MRRALNGMAVLSLCLAGFAYASPASAALEGVETTFEQARAEAIELALQDAAARAAQPPGFSHEPLAERMTLRYLPSGSSSGLSQTVRPLEKTRREVLAAQKRAGFQKLYKEGIGFEVVPGLGLSGRTEIFEQANPIDDYILEAKILNFSERSQFRRSITPLFIRSGAGRITADYEPWPRLSYEYDARTTLHEFLTRYGFKDIDLQTHAVNALYSFPEVPRFGTLTLKPWYKRVLQRSDHDLGAYEHRDELILETSVQHTDNIETYFKLDTYEASKVRTLGGAKLWLYQGQVRLRFPEWKLFAIPSFEYSVTDYDPSDDEFTKKTAFVDWGFDITSTLRASSKQEFVWTELTQAGQTPSNPDTQVMNWTNTLSYELFKDFDVSFGLDYSKGFGYGNYNNIGLRVETELFKAGLVRCRIGYEWLNYYNIGEELSLVFWKFHLFQ